MATVRLGRYEMKNRLLPPVCLKCGAEAVVERRKKFSWHPPWVAALLLLGLLPYVVVAIVLTKRMAVTVPFCEEHKGHWSRRTWFIWGGFSLFFILGVGAFILAMTQAARPQDRDQMVGWICGATIIAGVIWLIVAGIVQATGIRPTEITDKTITLTHVSPDFVAALKEERLRYAAIENE
jgi:hypothetical protein